MAIHLTTLTPASPLLSEFDQQRPDGLAKEIMARAVAMHLLSDNLASLVKAHDLIAPVIDAAAGSNVVNAVTKSLIAAGALTVPFGQTVSEAAVLLAGALAEVLNNQSRAFTPESAEQNGPSPSHKADSGPPLPDELDGLDLLSRPFEPLRLVLTRTIEAVRPDLYQQYRRIKDCSSPSAREDAYQFVFGVLRRLIEKQTGT